MNYLDDFYNRHNNRRNTVSYVTNQRVGPGLWGIGIIVGIILCILQGTGVINIGWFWATFPFWICPAIGLALGLIAVVIILIAVVVAALWSEN